LWWEQLIKSNLTLIAKGSMACKEIKFIFFLYLFTLATSQFYNISLKTWNKEYSYGKWQYLETVPIERSRNFLIAIFCDSYAKNGSILDIGSGEGVLSDFLNKQQKRKYVGIDISSVAVKLASDKRPNIKIVLSTAESFLPDIKYDIIIFNEVLYYTNHNTIMQKYSKFLNKNGLIIISVWFKESGPGYYPPNKMMQTIFSDAKKYFNQVDEMILHGFKNKISVAFQVGAFQLKNN
jgi:2-polyprenyl-6-hydroxyphenyl methylase/3-demethylubiquinone-9 3-methyltransferase